MTTPIAARLDSTDIEMLDRLVAEGIGANRSAVIRIALAQLDTDDVPERALRQARLQATEHEFADSMLNYDQASARAFGTVMAAALQHGRTSRVRVSDVQIASIAIANGLALYTIDVDDFAGIDGLDLRAVTAPG